MKTIVVIGSHFYTRENIRTLLADFCPRVKFVGEASTIKKGAQLVIKTRPDAILLEVSLEDGTGFDLLDVLPSFTGKVIFLAHNHECAFRAIKYGALDYLLLPVQLKELSGAIEKLIRIFPFPSPVPVKERSVVINKTSLQRITLHTHDSLIFVKLKHIIRLEAEGNYTYFYLANNRKVLVSRPLKDYEDLLPEESFFRVHQSHIVRIDSMKKIIKQDGGFIEMEDGSIIPISRRKKHDFLEYMQ